MRFSEILDFARRINAPGMTMGTGPLFGDEPTSDSLRRSADELSWRIEAASRHGIEVRIEGGVGGNADTPAKVLDLVDLTPGLKLTVDYCHFVYQGFSEEEIDPLLEHIGHFQCRGAAPGRMQVNFNENEIDYGRIVDLLVAQGYDAFFSIEYVWMNLWIATSRRTRWRPSNSATSCGPGWRAASTRRSRRASSSGSAPASPGGGC